MGYCDICKEEYADGKLTKLIDYPWGDEDVDIKVCSKCFGKLYPQHTAFDALEEEHRKEELG